MGFSFSEEIETIVIELELNKKNQDGLIEPVVVRHIFRAPGADELDRYRQILAQFRRKPRVNFKDAANYLWQKTIQHVEGYDELPENWKEFFLTNKKAQSHVTFAVDGLVDAVSPSVEFEKN